MFYKSQGAVKTEVFTAPFAVYCSVFYASASFYALFVRMPNGGKLRNVIGSVRYIVALCVARHYNFKLVVAAFDTAQKSSRSINPPVYASRASSRIIISQSFSRSKQSEAASCNPQKSLFSHIGHILKQLVVAFRQEHRNTRNVSQHFYFARFTVLKNCANITLIPLPAALTAAPAAAEVFPLPKP